MWNVVERDGKPYWFPAECDARIRKNWFWHPGDAGTLKSVEYLLKMYHGSVGHGAGLLLNVAPDDRGLLPEQDVQRLQQFRNAVEAIYAKDLLAGKPVEASSEAQGHAATEALDGELDTYWLAAEGDTEAWIEASFRRRISFDRIVTQEAIQLGQRIREYAVEVHDGQAWGRIDEGTSIGHKKIDVLDAPVTADRIRLLLKATDAPGLRRLAVYLAPEEYRQTAND
jgi:alpha-L-fucosidase